MTLCILQTTRKRLGETQFGNLKTQRDAVRSITNIIIYSLVSSKQWTVKAVNSGIAVSFRSVANLLCYKR